jgi:hypothetical protein
MSSHWQSILRQVQKFQEEAKRDGHPVWYRGQRRADWPVMSSLHRRVVESIKAVGVNVEELDKIEMMRGVYKTLYEKFKARAWHLLTIQEMSDWGIVFSMQHHGIPTRLLDWTESFTCALYFANSGRSPSDDAAIYLLNPQLFNAAIFKYEGLIAVGENIGVGNLNLTSYHPRYVSYERPLHTMAVAPIFTNPRMVAQQSAFTLSGDPFQSFDDRYKGLVKKITLPASTYKDSLRFLEIVGAGHFSYFPDLEGLRAELVAHLDREVELTQEYVARMAKSPKTGGKPRRRNSTK